MKWLAPLAAVLLAISCTPGQPTYLDQARVLADEKAHPVLRELASLLEKPNDLTADQLVQTWKQFLGDSPVPLRKDTTFTFVYYDFSHQLDNVGFEASFAPGRVEALTRVGTTSLFYRVYTVPKASKAKYRFSDGKSPLPDPFHPDIEAGPDLWHLLINPVSTATGLQWVSGKAEAALEDQDLTILLPPSYRRNLAFTYPLVVVAGLEGRGWTTSIEALMSEGAIRPLVVVSVGDVAGLKTVLEDRVVPWVRGRYRVSESPSDLVLVGWGPSAKPVQDLAAARPDFWTKTWTPLAAQARGEEAWNILAPPFFRTQFSVENP